MNLFEIFKLINRRIGQLIKKAERAIARQYAKTLVEIRKLMAEQYEKYEQNGELTLEEMLKYDRLKKLKKRINWIMGVNHKEVSKHMTQVLGDVYKEGYHLTAWGVETTTLTKLGYASVRPESLTAMLQNPVAGLTLKARLEKNRADIIHKIQQEVTQGLQENETYAIMAKRLKDSLEGDVVKATRIVRTEGHRVQESGKHDAAEHATKNGVIMGKQWNTLEDERVRPSRGKVSIANHRKLNNKIIEMHELFDDGLSKGPAPGLLPAAGSSINCRCFVTYTVLRIEKPQHKELENMAFEDWEKERLVTKPVTSAKDGKKPKVQSTNNKVVVKKKKTVAEKPLEKMSVDALKEEARKLAREYYPISGIDYGGNIEGAIDSLLSQNRSKTSLIKDIKSMRRKLENKDSIGTLQAKKHGKKTMITNQAIEKVPEIPIPGYSKEDNKTIKMMHQDLLRVAKTENEHNEVMFIRNNNGDLVKILGDINQVDPSKNHEAVLMLTGAKYQGLTVMHNHPGSSGFSLNDLRFFILNDAVKTLTIVTNLGQVKYVTKTSKYTKKKIFELLEKHFIGYNSDKELNERVNQFLKDASNHGILSKRR